MRKRGSGDVIPRYHNAKKQLAEAGADVVKIAAGLLNDPAVEPDVKLDLIGKLLPYLFAKAATPSVRAARMASSPPISDDNDGDEPVLSRDEILKQLDAIKAAGGSN